MTAVTVNPMINYRVLREKDNGLNVHDHYKHLTVEELRSVQEAERVPFSVAALNVTSDMNIGTLIRNACLTGAEDVYIIGRRKIDRRGTVGAQNYIKVHRIYALKDDGVTIDPHIFVQTMRENNLRPIFVEQGGLMLNEFNWADYLNTPSDLTTKPCLVFGNENSGIPDDILATQILFRGSFVVSIPQKGVLRSYNVGTSSGIVMTHMCMGMGWM